LDGCDWVFHSAGYPEQWKRDPGVFERVNTDGTYNMLFAAKSAGTRRFIFTSTIDVFTWARDKQYDETEIDPHAKVTWYERSKQKADALVSEANKSGMNCVFLHPAGVYGDAETESPGINDLIIKLKKHQVPMLLPGGLPLVYAGDVGEGHVLAAEIAPSGGRYILSERYVLFKELADIILNKLGTQQRAPPVMPYWLSKFISVAGETASNFTNNPPLIPSGQLHFLQAGARPVAERAKRELGLSFTSLEDGIGKTVSWLKKTGKLD
jgi:dihydroflavonol-4-reductase